MTASIEDIIRKVVREELKRHAKEDPPPSPPPPPAPRPQRAEPPPTIVHNCTCHELSWDTKRTAEFLGLARKTVYNLVSNNAPGFPQPRKHGSLNAFVRAEVIEYQRRILGLDEQ